MIINQYEIWIADLNPQFGSETGKTRLVLIVQTDLLNEIGHPSTIICPITTNVQNAEFLRVPLEEQNSNLKDKSDIMIDQIRTIDNKRFIKKVGNLDSGQISKVKENLKIILDLD